MSVDAVNRMLAFVDEHPLQEGQWLLGRGWDQNVWGTGFPTKEDLDPHFPSNPVWMSRVDGHAAWANSATLRAVPPLPEEDPDGGEIVRDEDGDLGTH